MSKEDFLEYVLPYRCSETYSTTARKFFWNRYHGIADSLKNENNLQKIANIVLADIDSWITEDPALASNLPATALVSFAAVSFFTADVSPAFKAVMVESNPICSE